jgi:hypothetical protein
MSLNNARIDELPLGVPSNGDFLVYRDQINGVTKRALVDPFLASPVDTNNFEWAPSPASYDEDDVVTYSGLWWQSLVNGNADNVPGVDPTKWIEVTRVGGSGIKVYESGVYVDDSVFVAFKVINHYYLFELVNPTRPFPSSNFYAEYVAGDWRGFGQIEFNSVDVTAAVQFNFFNVLQELTLNSESSITGPRTWSIINEGIDSARVVFYFQLDGLHVQSMPANFLMPSWVANWDSSAKTWTPTEIGKYKAIMQAFAGDWLLTIEGPFV